MMTLILKGTDGCNLRCAYCSLGEKGVPNIITEQTMVDALLYASRVCLARGHNELTVILHGGEPTLVPSKIYEAAFLAVNTQFPEISLHLSMQTNGYRISEEYLSFLANWHIRVGVSIDGLQAVHDLERRDIQGRETYQAVIQNIQRMQDADIPVSCLMVLTSAALDAPLDYLDEFDKKHLHLKINPLLNYGEAIYNPQLYLREGDYARYLIRVYQYLLDHELQGIISPLDSLLEAVFHKGRMRECTFSPDCSQRYLCIDHTGTIYPCGRLSDIHQFSLGNITEGETDLAELPELKALINRKSCALPQSCRECQYLSFCNAGCSAEAVIEGGLSQVPKLCADYKILFRYFTGDGLRLLRQHLCDHREKLIERIGYAV